MWFCYDGAEMAERSARLSMGVLQEDPYRKLHGCFRMLNGEIEILHYDMKATADTWRDRTQHSEP